MFYRFFSKHAWVVPFKSRKAKQLHKAFQKKL